MSILKGKSKNLVVFRRGRNRVTVSQSFILYHIEGSSTFGDLFVDSGYWCPGYLGVRNLHLFSGDHVVVKSLVVVMNLDPWPKCSTHINSYTSDEIVWLVRNVICRSSTDNYINIRTNLWRVYFIMELPNTHHNHITQLHANKISRFSPETRHGMSSNLLLWKRIDLSVVL